MAEQYSVATKALRVATLVIVAVIILVPLLAMNRESDVVSDIDNRKLTELSADEGVTSALLESYFSDRIGFRKELIGAYSLANDRLFGLMAHPTYEYGEDGYAFLRFSYQTDDVDFISTYAAYVAQMQRYCEERGVSFLYVISPDKKRTYADKLPASVNWQANSSAILRPMFDELGVNYIDLNDALVQAREEGAQVFNVVYDAGHWNTEGMYAGVRYIIDTLNDMGFSVNPINLDDYEAVYKEQTSLPASYYPIDEMTYKYQRIVNGTETHSMPGFSESVELDEEHRFLQCYENESIEDGVDLLMFQGSYFNYQGTMLHHQFAHAHLVHDYQNVLNLPYYMDVFDPDVVIFECADYTVLKQYYDYDKLRSIELPTAFESWAGLPVVDAPYEGGALVRDADAVVSNFSIWLPEEYQAVYVLAGDRVLDTVICDDGEIHWGVQTSELEGINTLEVRGVALDGSSMTRYIVPLAQ